MAMCCRYVAKYAVAPPAEVQVLQTAADVQVDEDVMQTPATDATAPKSHSQVSESSCMRQCIIAAMFMIDNQPRFFPSRKEAAVQARLCTAIHTSDLVKTSQTGGVLEHAVLCNQQQMYAKHILTQIKLSTMTC